MPSLKPPEKSIFKNRISKEQISFIQIMLQINNLFILQSYNVLNGKERKQHKKNFQWELSVKHKTLMMA